ncbi:uncharacterized protein LOC131663272 [Phymastichus coffea]|uniref:uncharacterized protein LOC131663272 n=1 Tax=Phymastichus coffea TaxID=108790 RepID=UPI00273CC0EA|nr:uncharacterized protein LOC131663272 [Phymastichus coffea]
MSNENSCSISDLVNEECHKERFRANKDIYKIDSLTVEDLQLLSLRVPGFNSLEKKSICDYHHKKYIKFYSHAERYCCDPCNVHDKNISNTLTIIDLKLAEKILKSCDRQVIPGKKLCKHCKDDFSTKIKNFEEKFKYCIDPFQKHRTKVDDDLIFLKQEYINYLLNVHKTSFCLEHKVCNACSVRLNSDMLKYQQSSKAEFKGTQSSPLVCNESQEISSTENTPGFTHSSSSSEFTSNSQNKRKLAQMLEPFDITFKRQKLNDDRIINEGVGILQDVVNQISQVFQNAHEVELPKFNNIKQMSNEGNWFQEIVTNIQKKYHAPATNYNEKVSLLTLLPTTWKYSDVKLYIPCSRYMFSEANKLREKTGILSLRKRKTYWKYSPEVRKEIVNFYLDDTNSSQCSGAKEKITVKVTGQQPQVFQKRIMLYDQKDLYNSWKEITTQSSIPCLAFFCQLQPPYCFFAGEPGTHNICVCSTHDNVKLKTAAVNPKISYREAIAASVCSTNNKCCMFRKCNSCPSQDSVYQFLSDGIDIESMRNVKYTIWSTTKVAGNTSENTSFSKISLIECDEPFEVLLNTTSEDIYNLTQHHFISSQQKDYYCQCRKTLDRFTAVLIIDFAENYSFIAQNSPQGLYFNNVQATLFTGVLYYKDNGTGDVSCQSYCVISDSKTHQAYSVNAFQEAILNEIKQEFPWITQLIYFSDGAPTQFKNKNHLINICYHEEDFGLIVVSYNFFMTSHGKSAADGIGAAAKRRARKAALQGHCILDAEQMYDYLSKTDSDIKYLYVSNDDVEARGKKLSSKKDSRFNNAKTIKNTRQYHCFLPIDLNTMKAKLYSFDTEFDVVNIA